MHPQTDFALAGMHLRQIHDLERLGPPELDYTNATHAKLLPTVQPVTAPRHKALTISGSPP